MNNFNFPQTVREYLARTGSTQRELARASKVSEVTLSNLLTGETKHASGKTIDRLWPIINSDTSARV